MSDPVVNAGGATAAPPAPPASAKPTPKPAAKPAKGETRREWWGTVAWTTFTASMIAMLLGTVRFLFPNVLSEPPNTFKGGDITTFEEGKVEDKFKDRGAWIILDRDEKNRRIIYALSTICTHLGCTPNWLVGEKKFKCPCHGSGFKISGVNFEGPAPRPLERYAVKKTDDNQVLVDKSKKYQKELGQWDDPDSFILV
ncbi:MAG: ubiquinol-cytochrome c reductase iron-sulfur subunit [Planctomycetes bacterium]|nr:ubiquinol-cytochrome c reductase iron-sulfur subunit [Planctomycetota bacterium]